MLTTYICDDIMSEVSGGIEFDWDAGNTRHLKRHRVTPDEFEEIMTGDPGNLEYQARNDEELYKVLGVTKASRALIGVWTPRRGKVRAVTAYPAGRVYRDLYWETQG
jgi:uncharacterized DUF497 family protein